MSARIAASALIGMYTKMIDQAFLITLVSALVLTPIGLWLANRREENEQRKLDAKLVELSNELNQESVLKQPLL
jgi:hypothetical protein